MRARNGTATRRWFALAWGAGLVLLGWGMNTAPAQEADYNAQWYNSSPYVQHGPGPAYSNGYADYGANANGLTGRFNSSYGEYGAVPGYGRWGTGSSWGTGPLRAAGTGRGARQPSDQTSRYQTGGVGSHWQQSGPPSLFGRDASR